ncbi:MAG: tyrosine-type recombinase/integrase [Eubacteriales bacterium]|nr:tyrosine-type recombinase/integrase [Eubacteriales bacterium]
MKKAPDFASIFTSRLKEYVAFMKDNDRKFNVETTILRAFDRYVCENNITTITEENVMGFTYSIPNLTKGQYDKRHRIIRNFSDYMNLREQGETIRPLPKNRGSGRLIPYVYTDDELVLLLEATKRLNPAPTLRPYTYYTMFGLLASTGIRISEALNLDISDIDLTNGILKIRNTKFKKSRLVPVHPTTLEVLREYDKLRCELMSNQKDNAFFPGRNRTRLAYGTVNSTFLEIVRTAGIRGAEGKGSRIHDLRHTFAIRRVAVWYDMGLDIHQMLPLLSTFMGHAHFEDTIYYLSAGAELLAKGSSRFKKDGDSIG